jgi:hypothetical protein
MPMKKYKPEQIVTLLRQVEVELANGKTTPQACKEAEITAQTYYRWRKEFGGLKLDQAKRLKEQCLAIRVARRLGRYEVIEALADVMLYRGVPENIRSDNGPEFVAEEVRK